MLHNYTHWLGPMVKENEYAFSEHNVRRLMMELSSPSLDIFAHLLSFFGHYGVPVFVFLSAYGLVMKYETGPHAESRHEESPWQFIKTHYLKLFYMMIAGYAMFLLVDHITAGPYRYKFMNVVGQLGMFSNLYADPDHAIWPGPYWYFGLMVQIYLLYRLVLYRGSWSVSGMLSHRGGNILLALLTVVCLAMQFVLSDNELALTWFRYNVFGSVLPFALGLVYARAVKSEGSEKSLLLYLDRNTNTSTKLALCIVLVFLIMYGSMYFWSWNIVPVFICALAVLGVKILPEVIIRPMDWVGVISAAIFVTHPIARKIIIPISRHGDLYTGLLIYIIVAIVLAVIFRGKTHPGSPKGGGS